MELTSYIVAPYDYDPSDPSSSAAANCIRAIISATTNRTVGQVTVRPQLTYMLSYLASDQIGAKTMVVESQYVDRNYLEDYAEYYSRCFVGRSRMCCRIHFFSKPFDETYFLDSLPSSSGEVSKLFSDSYLGYCVIRPIPETYLGRVNIKPYKNIVDTPDELCKVIMNSNKVSLFGHELTVDTIGLREQDRVVSACATSAVWALLRGSADLSDDRMPSLSRITKLANDGDLADSRVFPSKGLKPQEVGACLKKYDLEPLSYEISRNSAHEMELRLRRFVNAYVSGDIPVMIGGFVYRDASDTSTPKLELLGDHYVCALGYKKDVKRKLRSGLREDAMLLSQLYVHDDRYGQYLALSTETRECDVDGRTCFVMPIQQKLSSGNQIKDYFEPSHLILGTNHKIRVTFLDVFDIVNSLWRLLDTIHEDLAPDSKKSSAQQEKSSQGKTRLRAAIARLLGGTWDIGITTNSAYKKEILRNQPSSDDWSSSVGLTPSDFLAASLPRYFWRCRVRDPDRTCIMDLLFDATEIPQGDVFLCYVSYDSDVDAVWQELRNQVRSPAWANLCGATGEIVRGKLKSIESHLKTVDIALDALYGQARFPRRNLKTGELGEQFEVPEQQSLVSIPPYKNIKWTTPLKTDQRYIWVVDEKGYLIVGKDIRKKNPETGDYDYQGHPTLIDFSPARVGGELWFGMYRVRDGENKKESWWLNTRSGAYSGHLRDDAERMEVLSSVCRYKFEGFSELHGGATVLPTVYWSE